MTSRSFRLETRSRAKDEIKRIVQTVEKVRKWEKKWVDVGLSNALKVYKWIPMREEAKDGDAEEEENKENEIMEVTDRLPLTDNNCKDMDCALPEILLAAGATLESSFVRDQAPPQMLLVSEETSGAHRESAMMEQEQDLATGLASELQNSVENGLLDAQLVEDNLALLSVGRAALNDESSTSHTYQQSLSTTGPNSIPASSDDQDSPQSPQY